MISLKNKNILLIMPKFFDYEIDIKNSLIEKGAKVYLIYGNVKELSFVNRFICKYTKYLSELLVYNYFFRKINYIRSLDYVFVIKGNIALNESILEYILKKFPNVIMYMYLWDNVINSPNTLNIVKYFKQISTFDREDSIQYKWHFLPLFYSRNNIQQTIYDLKKYDFAFVGTIHSDRAYILNKLKKISSTNHYSIFYYLFAGSFLSCCFQVFTGKQKHLWNYVSLNDINYISLTRNDIYDIYENTKVIIDYSLPNQKGLSFRTIECLGMETKMMTNNNDIKNYDFYNPNNIFIYNKNDFCLPNKFLEQPYEPIDKVVVEKYSLSNWIEQIFAK